MELKKKTAKKTITPEEELVHSLGIRDNECKKKIANHAVGLADSPSQPPQGEKAASVRILPVFLENFFTLLNENGYID